MKRRIWVMGLIGGCAHLPEVRPLAAGAVHEGLVYYLPKTHLTATFQLQKTTVDLSKAQCAGFLIPKLDDDCPTAKAGSGIDACAVWRVAKEAGLMAPGTAKTSVRVLSSTIEPVSVADPDARFAVIVSKNVSLDLSQKLSWTADGRLSGASSTAESKVAGWITGSLTLLGKLVGSIVGGGGPALAAPPPPSAASACHSIATQLVAVNRSLASATFDSEATPEAMEWTKKHLLAEQAALRGAFTGAVTVELGGAFCSIDPGGAASGTRALFTLDPADGLCAIDPACEVSASLLGSPKAAGAPACPAAGNLVGGPRRVTMTWKELDSSPSKGVSATEGTDGHSFWYRIPAISAVSISDTSMPGGAPLVTKQVALPQAGVKVALPMLGGRGAASADITIDPATGMLTGLTLGAKAVDLGAVTPAVTGMIDTLSGLDTLGETSEAERISAQTGLIQAQTLLLQATKAYEDELAAAAAN